MTLPVSTSGGRLASRLFGEGCCGGVFGGVVGLAVGPAAPDHPDPGAGEDAHGVGVVLAGGAGLGGRRPACRRPRAQLERATPVAEHRCPLAHARPLRIGDAFAVRVIAGSLDHVGDRVRGGETIIGELRK